MVWYKVYKLFLLPLTLLVFVSCSRESTDQRRHIQVKPRPLSENKIVIPDALIQLEELIEEDKAEEAFLS